MTTSVPITPFITSTPLLSITNTPTLLLSNISNGRFFIVFKDNSNNVFAVVEVLVLNSTISRTDSNTGSSVKQISDTRLLILPSLGDYSNIFYYIDLTSNNFYLSTSETGTSSSLIITIASFINTMNVSNIMYIDNIYQMTSNHGIVMNNEVKLSKGVSHGLITITTNTTLDNTHDTILCNISSPGTLTLPLSVTYPGKEYIIINQTSNAVGIQVSGSDHINDTSTTSISLSTLNSKCRIVSDGSSMWYSW